MQVEQAIRERFSVRAYESKEVEEEKIQALLEAARIAPTAANMQPVHIYVAKSAQAIEKVSKACNLHGAPLAMIVCADVEDCWHRQDGFRSYRVDATIATDEMMLLATELGLGSLWICAFNADILAQEFDLPATRVPVNILALGYGAQREPDDRLEKRKPVSELAVVL